MRYFLISEAFGLASIVCVFVQSTKLMDAFLFAPKLGILQCRFLRMQNYRLQLTMLVEKMYSIYYNQYVYSKAEEMNKEIAPLLPKIKKLGLEVPEYVTSGEKFIDYMNNLTDNTVPYKEEIQDPYSR